MKISELTELVSLVSPVQTQDEYGGIDLNKDVAAESTFYCNIKSDRSFTTSSEGNSSELELWRCTMRKDDEINLTLKKLIYWRFQYYTITSIANVDEGKYQWVRFTITKLNV
jgi:hypothetical protein